MTYQDWSDDDAYDAAESRGEAYAEQLAEWADNELRVDRKGFIHTGSTTGYTYLETSEHGIFAAGDVRSESVKRVSAAAGEGSMAVSEIHKYLSQPTIPATKGILLP